MREINLPDLASGPATIEDCLALYLHRLKAVKPWTLNSGLLLIAYMAWPNDENRRQSWMATCRALFPSLLGDTPAAVPGDNAIQQFDGVHFIALPAMETLERELVPINARWIAVAEVLQRFADIAADKSLDLKGGPSIAKAVDLCEFDGKSVTRSQLLKAWGTYRDAAHLIASGAFLALRAPDPTARRIFGVALIAPEALLALAAGFQELGLGRTPFSRKTPLLPPTTVWRVPKQLRPEKRFMPSRRLNEAQKQFLSERRARTQYVRKPAAD